MTTFAVDDGKGLEDELIAEVKDVKAWDKLFKLTRVCEISDEVNADALDVIFWAALLSVKLKVETWTDTELVRSWFELITDAEGVAAWDKLFNCEVSVEVNTGAVAVAFWLAVLVKLKVGKWTESEVVRSWFELIAEAEGVAAWDKLFKCEVSVEVNADAVAVAFWLAVSVKLKVGKWTESEVVRSWFELIAEAEGVAAWDKVFNCEVSVEVNTDAVAVAFWLAVSVKLKVGKWTESEVVRSWFELIAEAEGVAAWDKLFNCEVSVEVNRDAVAVAFWPAVSVKLKVGKWTDTEVVRSWFKLIAEAEGVAAWDKLFNCEVSVVVNTDAVVVAFWLAVSVKFMVGNCADTEVVRSWFELIAEAEGVAPWDKLFNCEVSVEVNRDAVAVAFWLAVSVKLKVGKWTDTEVVRSWFKLIAEAEGVTAWDKLFNCEVSVEVNRDAVAIAFWLAVSVKLKVGKWTDTEVVRSWFELIAEAEGVAAWDKLFNCEVSVEVNTDAVAVAFWLAVSVKFMVGNCADTEVVRSWFELIAEAEGVAPWDKLFNCEVSVEVNRDAVAVAFWLAVSVKLKVGKWTDTEVVRSWFELIAEAEGVAACDKLFNSEVSVEVNTDAVVVAFWLAVSVKLKVGKWTDTEVVRSWFELIAEAEGVAAWDKLFNSEVSVEVNTDAVVVAFWLAVSVKLKVGKWTDTEVVRSWFELIAEAEGVAASDKLFNCEVSVEVNTDAVAVAFWLAVSVKFMVGNCADTEVVRSWFELIAEAEGVAPWDKLFNCEVSVEVNTDAVVVAFWLAVSVKLKVGKWTDTEVVRSWFELIAEAEGVAARDKLFNCEVSVEVNTDAVAVAFWLAVSVKFMVGNCADTEVVRSWFELIAEAEGVAPWDKLFNCEVSVEVNTDAVVVAFWLAVSVKLKVGKWTDNEVVRSWFELIAEAEGVAAWDKLFNCEVSVEVNTDAVAVAFWLAVSVKFMVGNCADTEVVRSWFELIAEDEGVAPWDKLFNCEVSVEVNTDAVAVAFWLAVSVKLKVGKWTETDVVRSWFELIAEAKGVAAWDKLVNCEVSVEVNRDAVAIAFWLAVSVKLKVGKWTGSEVVRSWFELIAEAEGVAAWDDVLNSEVSVVVNTDAVAVAFWLAVSVKLKVGNCADTEVVRSWFELIAEADGVAFWDKVFNCGVSVEVNTDAVAVAFSLAVSVKLKVGKWTDVRNWFELIADFESVGAWIERLAEYEWEFVWYNFTDCNVSIRSESVVMKSIAEDTGLLFVCFIDDWLKVSNHTSKIIWKMKEEKGINNNNI